MAVTDTVPGMEPRRTSRNLVLGAAYVIGAGLLVVTARCYRPYRGC